MTRPNLAALWPYDRKTTVSILYLAAIWFATHGYYGVWGDGLLYAGQALSHLYPDAFRQDLFFLFGSQDDFTIYGRLYAIAIAWTGLHGATVGMIVVANAAWIAGAVFVLRRLALPERLKWVSLVLLFALPSAYGAEHLIGFFEAALTPRIWAEAFGLAAIASALARQTLPSLAFCALAALFHPIIALPAIAFSVLYRLRFEAAAALTLAGLVLIIVVASLPAGWLPGRLGFMDAAWFGLVVERSPFAVISQWSGADFGEIVFLMTMLGCAALRAPAPLGAASRTVLLVTALFLAASCIGALTQHALLVQAQLWRVLWLTKVFAILAAAWLFAQYWGKSRAHNFVLAALGVIWVTAHSLSGYLGLPVAALLFRLDCQEGQNAARHAQLIGLVTAVVALVVGIRTVPGISSLFAQGSAFVPDRVIADVLIEFGWVILVLPFIAARKRDLKDVWKHAGILCVLVFLILSVFHWDRRLADLKRVCIWTPGCLAELDRSLPKSAVVYWEDTLYFPWLILHRPNYGGFAQAAGLLFSRETAMEARRRQQRLEKLGTRDGTLDWHRMQYLRDSDVKSHYRFEGLIHVCHDRAVDYLILEAEFGQASPRAFDEPVLNKRYFVYDCGLVRDRFADPYAGP